MFAMLAASLAVAQPQPAAWATDAREPLCVFDGLMDETLGQPDSARISAECQQRFGWTLRQGATGLAAAYATATALQARNDAVAAGVSIETIERIMNSFSASERALVGPARDRSEENARRFAALLFDRLTAQGLRGEARNKAAHAVIQLVNAGRVVADFSREIGVAVDP